VIAGKDLALCGQGTQYQLVEGAPAGSYHWHLERDDTKGPAAIWNGNARHPSLTLAFADGPGAYRLWVQEDGGAESNHLEITALAAEPLPPLPEDLPRATLETALPAAHLMTALELAATAQGGEKGEPRPIAPPALPPPPIPPRSNLGVLKPDAQGVIDLVAAEPPPEIEPIPNPFRVRAAAVLPAREVPILVSAVMAAAETGQSCGIINGQLVSIGDAVEGFTLAAVAADTIELRSARATLEVPVQDEPVLLRLPR
jgi:hypothetical protein